VETVNAWMVRIFWLGVAKWAAHPGNDARAAVFVEGLLERVVATSEAAAAASSTS
jgi:hypothetical protein